MLKGDTNQFLWRYETRMYSGNTQWADPEEATRVGESIGEELIGRFGHLDRDTDPPQVKPCAHRVLDAALEVINYAALPTERRANILRGVISSLESNGALGGRPEWAESPNTAAPSPDADNGFAAHGRFCTE